MVEPETSPELRSQLQGILQRYQDVFSNSIHPDGADIPPMEIRLAFGASAVAEKARRMAPPRQRAIQQQISDMLDVGIIQESSSPWASPLVITTKKDGELRMCVDYRSLNTMTIADRYPMQHVKSILERLSGMSYFAVLDLKSGYHQMPIHPNAQPLTAFITPFGLFEFRRVPFGLRNAPAYFQRSMALVLNGLLGNACEVYLDDIVIYAPTPDAFCANLALVLERLQQRRITIKPAKCQIGVRSVTYLGLTVSGVGITAGREKLQGVADVAMPRNRKQLKSFLGLANYFRDFIHHFAQIARPLYELTSKKTAFEWTDEHANAFHNLKEAILNVPMLHHMRYDLPIVLRTDASQFGIGGVLIQLTENGNEQYVAFVSKKLSRTQVKWSTIELEAYAIPLLHNQTGTLPTGHRVYS